MKIALPFHAENIRKLTFFNSAGEPLYTTDYRVIDNTIEEAIPYKYLFAKKQRYAQLDIIKMGEGTFYILQTGIFDRKFCIEHNKKVYLGYSIDKGKSNFVSIYNEDKQIAQITKPLTVIDNLDIYFLHIKDEYTSLIPILSFFTVYYDYRKYNNSGKLTKNSVEINVSYSHDKNNSRYNPDWIAQEFGQQVSEELERELEKIYRRGADQGKKIVKIVGIIFLILIVLGVILFFVLWNIFI